MNSNDINELLTEYQTRFGKPYLHVPEWQTEEEVLKGMSKCLKSGIPREDDKVDTQTIY